MGSHPFTPETGETMSRRTRYQNGSVQRENRRSGPDVWVFRWWEPGSDGESKRRKAIVGNVLTLPTEAIAPKQLARCASTLTHKPRRQTAGRKLSLNWLLTIGLKSWQRTVTVGSRFLHELPIEVIWTIGYSRDGANSNWIRSNPSQSENGSTGSSGRKQHEPRFGI
jgi:hypothetical protein